MRVVDANVLLNAVNTSSIDHRAARQWMERSLNGAESVGFSWPVLVAFLRVSTREWLFEQPLTPSAAWGQIDAWLATRPATLIQPTSRHAEVMRGLLTPLGVIGKLADDAHLAALAVENRAVMVSFDSDFARFPDVRWERPS